MAAPVGVLFGLLAPFVLLTLALSGTVWEKAWEKAWLHRAQVGIALWVAMIQNGGLLLQREQSPAMPDDGDAEGSKCTDAQVFCRAGATEMGRGRLDENG